MDAVIYLEPDEEITSVIEKLKQSKSPVVGIVAPRNAIILQSVVNLKLLKKEAENLKKDISLVTSDKIGQNLAMRTGLTVYENIHDTKPLAPPSAPKPQAIIEEESSGSEDIPQPTSSYKVHRYDEESDLPEEDEEPLVSKTFTTKNIESKSTSQEESSSKEPAEDEPEDQESPEEVIAPKSEPKKEAKIKEVKSADSFRSSTPLKPARKINYTKFIPAIIFIFILAGLFFYGYIQTNISADIKVVVDSEDIKETLEFQVNKDQSQVNSVKNIIPARLIESTQEATQTVKATGKKDVGQKAAGTMTVSNETGISQSFEVGTAFKNADNNLIFRNTKAFTVPAGSSSTDWRGGKWVTTITPGKIEIPVSANEPGDNYNTDAATYTIANYSFVTAKGSAMTGGLTKEVTVIAKDDVDKATKEISESLYKKAKADLVKKSGDAIFLEDAIKNEILDTTANAEIGEQSEDFTYTVKTKTSILTFDKDKYAELITNSLKNQVPEGKSLLTADTKDIKTEIVATDPSQVYLKLKTTAKGKIIPNLKEDKIKTDLLGKTKEESSQYFSKIDGVSSAEISLTPSWYLKTIPTNASKTKIEIKAQ